MDPYDKYNVHPICVSSWKKGVQTELCQSYINFDNKSGSVVVLNSVEYEVSKIFNFWVRVRMNFELEVTNSNRIPIYTY